MDFTLQKYGEIIEAGLRGGYRHFPVIDWHANRLDHGAGIVLRHDVDRRPENALAMALLENKLGVRSSYYFRSLPCSFVPAIIERIRDLNHEIGYHYEDWHLAGRDVGRAVALFERNLDKLRSLAPVRSIAMHGSPLSRENNMTIWRHANFSDFNVIDAILSFDYKDFVFFTDSGRTFGQSGANLRDYLGEAGSAPEVHSSDDLKAFLVRRSRELIQINVHPERWNNSRVAWTRQLAWDKAANTAKRALKMLRK